MQPLVFVDEAAEDGTAGVLGGEAGGSKPSCRLTP